MVRITYSLSPHEPAGDPAAGRGAPSKRSLNPLIYFIFLGRAAIMSFVLLFGTTIAKA
jgi:hypothetical protein